MLGYREGTRQDADPASCAGMKIGLPRASRAVVATLAAAETASNSENRLRAWGGVAGVHGSGRQTVPSHLSLPESSGGDFPPA